MTDAAPLRSRADFGFAAALGTLPFLGYVRAQPSPGFWAEWVAVAVVLLWLAVTGLPRRGWLAGEPFLAVAVLMLVHLAARLVPMPVEVLVAAALLVVAAAVAARAASGAGETMAAGLAVGLIAAFALNAVAVGFERLGYEWQLIALHRIDTPARAVGLVGQSNHLATLAVLATAAAFCLRLAGRWPRWALWLVTLAAALVVAASSSRAGMVVAAAVLLLLGAACLPRAAERPVVSRGEWFGLAALFLLVQLVWIFAPAGHAPAAVAAGGTELLIARSDAGRSSLWNDALALWRAHPLLGVGHGNYAQARLHELSGPMPAPHVDHAHNLFLQVASEWGLAGLLIVVLSLVWLGRAGWRVLRAPAPPRLFALALVAALLVHGMAEHPMWFPHFLFAFALAIGVLVGGAADAEAPPRSRGVIAVGVAVALLVAGIAAFDYQRLHRIAAALRADAQREPGTPAQLQLADVIAVERLTLYPRPATLLLSAVLPINPAAAEAKLEVTRRAMDMIPAGQTVARWAAFCALTGRQDEARTLLLGLRTRHPPSYAEARDLLLRSTFGQAVLADFAASLPPP